MGPAVSAGDADPGPMYRITGAMVMHLQKAMLAILMGVREMRLAAVLNSQPEKDVLVQTRIGVSDVMYWS